MWWSATASGSTLGQPGPEGGFIVRDESTAKGERLLLEEDPTRGFFVVVASIPRWLVHPRFFESSEAAARAFEDMKAPLLELSAKLPTTRPGPGTKELSAFGALLSEFVTRFS